MLAEIISIGNEILKGDILNRNATYLGKKLYEKGVAVTWMTSVSDDENMIVQAFNESDKRADLVLVTGGLGPTHDDVTKKAICQGWETTLEPNVEAKEFLLRRLEKQGRTMNVSQEKQTWLPAKGSILVNNYGTASGVFIQGKKARFFFFPGVPHEMQGMVEDHVLPYLKENHPDLVPRKETTLRTIGAPESSLYEKLDGLSWLKNTDVAFLPKIGGVDVIIKHTPESTPAQQEEILHQFRQKIGLHVYSEVAEEEIEETVGKLLVQQKKTLAVAESCTGGLLGHRLTSISGSSLYFQEGVISYSNEAKKRLLEVKEETLDKFGAVSEACALEMAQGVRRLGQTDIGISITGIAGPTGGTKEKPLGLVYIAYSDEEKSLCHSYVFLEPRHIHKQRSSQAALHLLWEQIKDEQK